MKSTVSVCFNGLVQFAELGRMDFEYYPHSPFWGKDPVLNSGATLALNGALFLRRMKRQAGTAELDWGTFTGILITSKYKPALTVNSQLFSFTVESPLKEYPNGITIISGWLTSEISRLFKYPPFLNLISTEAPQSAAV